MRLALLLGVVQALLVTYDRSQNLMEKTWMTMFHVSWCKHCKQVKPEFASAAARVAMRFVTVDCESFADVCKSLGIQSYPTLRLYSAGEMVEYVGGRMAEDFEEFAQKVSHPPVHILEFEDWRRQIGKQLVSFTLMLNPDDKNTKEMQNAFNSVAETLRYQTVFFYQVPYKETKVIVSGKDYRENYDLSNFSERELLEFIELHRLPTILEMGSESLPLIKPNTRSKILIVLAFDSHDLDAKFNLDPFFKIARYYRRQANRKVQFCFVEAQYSSEQLEPFELQSIPSIIALDIRTETALFSALPDPTTTSAEKFIVRVLKGEEALAPMELGYWFYTKKIVLAFLSSEFIYDNPVFFFLLLFSLAVCIGICAAEMSKPKED